MVAWTGIKKQQCRLCVKVCTILVVEGTSPVGKPRKTWQNTVSADMCLLKGDPWDVHD